MDKTTVIAASILLSTGLVTADTNKENPQITKTQEEVKKSCDFHYDCNVLNEKTHAQLAKLGLFVDMNSLEQGFKEGQLTKFDISKYNKFAGPVSLDNEPSSKDIETQLINRGINSMELSGVTYGTVDYESGYWDNETVTMEDLFGKSQNPFTSTNIGEKFESMLSFANKKKNTTYKQGDWKQIFEELAPNDDEVDALNKFSAILPKEMKIIPTVNGYTGFMSLYKFSNNKDISYSDLTDAEKVILAADLYSAKAAINSSATFEENPIKLILPMGMEFGGKELTTEKGYTITNATLKDIETFSKLDIELPIQMVEGFNEIYSSYVEGLEISITSLEKKQVKYEGKILETKNEKKKSKYTERAKKYESKIASYKDAKDMFDELSTQAKIDTLTIFTSMDKDNLGTGSKSDVIALINMLYGDFNAKKVKEIYSYLSQKENTKLALDIMLNKIDKMAKEENKMTKEENKMAKKNLQFLKSLIAAR